MTQTIELASIDIVLVAQKHNPTILNPDFLKYNHIVPENWKLKKNPICIEPMAQVSFDNDIEITAELGRVIFHESVKQTKDLSESRIHEIVIKYLSVLPHVNYLSAGINPRGHLVFTTMDDAQDFIKDTFTRTDVWMKFDNKPTNVGFRFSYACEKAIMNLDIKALLYNVSKEEKVPVVLFAANFHHNLTGDTRDAKLSNLNSIISEWHEDIDRYKEFVAKLIE